MVILSASCAVRLSGCWVLHFSRQACSGVSHPGPVVLCTFQPLLSFPSPRPLPGPLPTLPVSSYLPGTFSLTHPDLSSIPELLPSHGQATHPVHPGRSVVLLAILF